MKRTIAMVVVLLFATVAAQAYTAVYAEIAYPTTTTWKLYLQECDWTGSNVGLTASGFGIASFAIDVSGVLTASKNTPNTVTLYDDMDTEMTAVGFPEGPGGASVVGGVAQAFAGQKTTCAEGVIYGFGVTPGSYTPPAGWYTSGPYSWVTPGAPGSATPGVAVFQGKRDLGATVAIVWGDRTKANVFSAGSGVGTETVPVVPEPATLALLVLGGFAALRRRR